jgi:hypothetical protein
VKGKDGAGYVELPYTLPQDSTLFNLLREPSIDIWKMKLDWIAQHGGMALVNVHPDYLSFDGRNRHANEYPVGLYEEFLGWVKEKYASRCWQVAARDVALFYRQTASLFQGQGPLDEARCAGRTESIPELSDLGTNEDCFDCRCAATIHQGGGGEPGIAEAPSRDPGAYRPAL